MVEAANRETAEVRGKGEPRLPFHRRRPRLTLLLLNVVGLGLLLVVLEVCLRWWGYVPGSLEWGWGQFKPLAAGESLQVSHQFYTDSLGIWKATTIDSIQGPGIHVNRDGFRGPDFEAGDSTRPKVMLIGDSFTWGATATPIGECFADRLRAGPWQVMNLGIPGADPDQYAAIAEHYVPRLRPDVVCVFFYMANDRMNLPMTVAPGQSRYHITNVGWLNPFVDGEYVGDAEATYAYFMERFRVPQGTWFGRICSPTVIGTFAWIALHRMGWASEGYSPRVQALADRARALQAAGPYSGGYMQRVAAVCKEAGVPLQLYVIPSHNAIGPPAEGELERLFAGIPYLMPENLVAADYNPSPDGHFNNAGHAKMAEFVREHVPLALHRP